MRVTLLNPPHTAIGSRIPDEHLPPLGLLAVGGPLLDAGHVVCLMDADLSSPRTGSLDPGTPEDIVARVQETHPDVVLVGHSGSTSAHPTVVRLARGLKSVLPDVPIVYGGGVPDLPLAGDPGGGARHRPHRAGRRRGHDT